jgi:bifunctional UDP-N-acetylglucosamine pyrophosphorylase / glucosamine-1-phosphate N-acetyltransferase
MSPSFFIICAFCIHHSFSMSLSAIILAAGRSSRMKTNRPKVLHEVCGKPMLHYVIDACFQADCQRVTVVVGQGKEEVMAAFAHERRVHWVEQTELLGTGHAARVCTDQIKAHPGNLFILAGDGPLIRAQVLKTLLHAHQEERAAASMATAMLDNPSGYGRIARDAEGNFLDIIEDIDATPEQREIREVFPSYYCFRSEDLLAALPKLESNNKKHEYYLTDVYGILRRMGKKVVAVQAVAAEDTLSINTRQQLADVDGIMQERIQRSLREKGVTIVSGQNTYIEAGVSIGADTAVHPFTFIGSDASIGSGCTIGPFAFVPSEAIVRENLIVRGNHATEMAS